MARSASGGLQSRDWRGGEKGQGQGEALEAACGNPRDGEENNQFGRGNNAGATISSPPSRAMPKMASFRHRMHRVMRTRRGGAGAGDGSDRRLLVPGVAISDSPR